MGTEEEKNKLAKLLQGLEVQEIKLPERCTGLLMYLRQKKIKDVKDEDLCKPRTEIYENPYRVDPRLREENEKKLRELLSINKSFNLSKKEHTDRKLSSDTDSNKPWRTHSNKEKLIRINSELERHLEKGSEMIMPLSDGEMKDLIMQSTEKSFESPANTTNKLRATVDAAKKDLPNFQYRKIYNSSATEIIREAYNRVS